jgi:hypothetical protein
MLPFMKKRIALLGGLMIATLSLSAAEPTPGSTAPAVDVKKTEEPKIEGVVIARPNGTFLGLKVEDNKFKLSFYDKKKKPMEVDVARASLWWNPNYTVSRERTVLNPTPDGKSLDGGIPIRGPHAFIVHLALIQGDGDAAEATETYTVDFKD